MSKPLITQQRLKELLSYNEETGEFCWIEKPKNQYKDRDFAGWVRKDGYKSIMINGKSYFSHRLALLYVYGYMPVMHVDHIDGNPLNNAIANLREVGRTLNMQNQKRAQKSNILGILGVRKAPGTCKFISRIQVNKKPIFLGSFDTAEAAHEAYLNAKRNLHLSCTI